jgi:hypothetical protein
MAVHAFRNTDEKNRYIVPVVERRTPTGVGQGDF